MTDIETHQCETDCGRPAPTTRMCWDCVQQITNAIDRALEVAAGLVKISRREMAPQLLRTESTTRPAYGPTEPMNLTALAILQDLDAWDRLTAAEWSTVENPKWWHHWVQARTQMAVDMVEGEREPRVDMAAIRAKIAHDNRPMPIDLLVPHLSKLSVRVTVPQVRQWATRKKLTRVDSGGNGQTAWFRPTDVIACLYPPTPEVGDTEQDVAELPA